MLSANEKIPEPTGSEAVLLEINGKNYYFGAELVTLFEATLKCYHVGGYVFTPEDNVTNNVVAAEWIHHINKYPLNTYRRFWIGLTDIRAEGT